MYRSAPGPSASAGGAIGRRQRPVSLHRWGGDIRLIAFITEPGPIRKILKALGAPREPPPLAPARGPPTVLSLTGREPTNMVTHMKTTVDIADDLLLRAKREAKASQTTLRSLIEEGLREVLGRKALSKQKPIKPVTFRGKGLQPAFRGKGWDAIRDAIYGTAES